MKSDETEVLSNNALILLALYHFYFEGFNGRPVSEKLWNNYPLLAEALNLLDDDIYNKSMGFMDYLNSLGHTITDKGIDDAIAHANNIINLNRMLK